MERLRGALTGGGADVGDARMESGTEEGLWWQKTDEVDAWAMGDECAVLRHGRTRRTTCRGENFLAGERQLCFKGSGGEGAEGWAPRGGRVGEREGERGALCVAWSNVAAWHRCGSGPVVAHAGGASPHDSGGRRGQRDTDGVADRWAGT
jgi:hypothetical protein